MAFNDSALLVRRREQALRIVCQITRDPVAHDWNTLEPVNKARKCAKRRETERWERLTSQGHRVRDFKGDKIENSWLRNRRLLKQSCYIDAIKLRTNIFGIKIVLNRISLIDVKYRRCTSYGCASTQRQSALGGTIKSRTTSWTNFQKDFSPSSRKWWRWTATSRNRIWWPKRDGDQKRLMMVDVTVRYENRRSLADAFREKTRKYKTTADNIRKRLGCTTTEVLYSCRLL